MRKICNEEREFGQSVALTFVTGVLGSVPTRQRKKYLPDLLRYSSGAAGEDRVSGCLMFSR
jgi:hypothetical protein